MATDLGFSYLRAKDGAVAIRRAGRVVTVLREATAADFLAEAEGSDPGHVRQLMARLTGNCKRGNERLAARHPGNRMDG